MLLLSMVQQYVRVGSTKAVLTVQCAERKKPVRPLFPSSCVLRACTTHSYGKYSAYVLVLVQVAEKVQQLHQARTHFRSCVYTVCVELQGRRVGWRGSRFEGMGGDCCLTPAAIPGSTHPRQLVLHRTNG